MGVAGISSRLTPALARYSDLSGSLPRYRGFFMVHRALPGNAALIFRKK